LALQAELEFLGVSSGSVHVESYDAEGGVEVRGVSPETLWRIVLYARLADNVRVRLGQSFHAQNWRQLQRGLRSLPFASFYTLAEQTANNCPTIRVSTRRSTLYHTDAIADRVRAHLTSQATVNATVPATTTTSSSSPRVSGIRPPDLFVRVDTNRVQVSVEAARHMWKRTLHAANVKWVSAAPLRESIASALLFCAEWPRVVSTAPPVDNVAAFSSAPRRHLILWDPFCGSGTILFEALVLARLLRNQQSPSSPPHFTPLSHFATVENASATPRSFFPCCRYRTLVPTSSARLGSYPFEQWPCHDAAAFAAFVRANRPSHSLASLWDESSLSLQFVGSDIDADAIRAAVHNRDLLVSSLVADSTAPSTRVPPSDLTASAFVNNVLHFECGDFEDVWQRLLLPQQQRNIPIAIVTNLPYGVRSTSVNTVPSLYQRWQRFLSRHRNLWHSVHFLAPRSHSHIFASSTSCLLSFRNRGAPQASPPWLVFVSLRNALSSVLFCFLAKSQDFPLVFCALSDRSPGVFFRVPCNQTLVLYGCTYQPQKKFARCDVWRLVVSSTFGQRRLLCRFSALRSATSLLSFIFRFRAYHSV